MAWVLRGRVLRGFAGEVQREARNSSRSAAQIRRCRAESAGPRARGLAGRANCRALAPPSAGDASSMKFKAPLPACSNRGLLFAARTLIRHTGGISLTNTRSSSRSTDAGFRNPRSCSTLFSCEAASIPPSMSRMQVWLRLVPLTPAKHLERASISRKARGPAVRSYHHCSAARAHTRTTNANGGCRRCSQRECSALLRELQSPASVTVTPGVRHC
jgi:hypothetical protein